MGSVKNFMFENRGMSFVFQIERIYGTQLHFVMRFSS
jgi:hypothetical protein